MKGSMMFWLVLGSLWCCSRKSASKSNPWERDALGDHTMRPDRDPVTGVRREHMWFSREASNGGGAGGGCN